MLYNAMIAPLAPCAIKGAIWYQGESNASRSYQYRKLLPAMIKNWRETFGLADFPFLVVQIAPYTPIVQEPSDSVCGAIRAAQLTVTQNVPKTGLIVSTVVDDGQDRHTATAPPASPVQPLAAVQASAAPHRGDGPRHHPC